MCAKPFHFSKSFLQERCDYCGRCFTECPVLQLPLPNAQQEIRLLVESGHSHILDKCTGCMACNSICPQAANPHTLIVKAWGDRYRKEGLPHRARLALPYQKRNIHQVARSVTPEEEQQLLRQWEENWRHPPKSDVMIYAGCNMMLLPFLLDSPFYAETPIFGSLDICCGEPLYRMGCWDAAKAAALTVQQAFKRMACQTIIVPCLACYHLFTHVYPHILDVSLGVEILTIEEWLIGQIENKRIAISPLEKKVVLHDNCWPKASGDVLFDQVRHLLMLIGVSVTEPAHAREMALCCGMCAAASRYRLRDVLRTAKILLQELEQTPGDSVVEYCGGCVWLLSLVNQALLSPYAKPRHHILELVYLAAGVPIKHRTDQRMRSIMRAMAPSLPTSYLRPGRFWIDNIAGNPVHPQE